MSRRTFSLLFAVCTILLLIIGPSIGLAEDPPPDPPEGSVFEPQFSYDVGTHFEVTESEYLNVTLDSSEIVRVFIQSIPNVVTINIEPQTAAATAQLTIGGLLPDTTYYKYVDGLETEEPFTTDASGTHVFLQDITVVHTIHILTGHSTLFLKDDATGGDCGSIGVWDTATKTCTLTSDVSETVQINDWNITLEGNGHTLTCQSGTYGVYLDHTRYTTVRNLNITGCYIGLYANYSSYNTIEANKLTGNSSSIILGMIPTYNVVANNTVTNNTSTGISCYYACNNNIFNGNFLQHNANGFYMWSGFNNVYSNNTVDSNTSTSWASAGIDQLASSNNLYEGNTFSNNVTGFAIRDATYCSGCGGGSGNNTFRFNNVVGNTYVYYTRTGFNNPSPTPHNKIYANNFIDNAIPVYDTYGFVNEFSLPLPTGGNYWSEYDSPVEGCTDGDADGFCDAPYVLSAFHQDDYPLAAPVPVNSEPIADAGTGQAIECPSSLSVPVTLDGSGSYDPDGDAITHTWIGPFGTAYGESPTVTLPWWGTYSIPLIVEDPYGASDVASVTITVGDSKPPVTTASVIGVKDTTGIYTSDVTVILSAEDECTGVGEIHYIINSEPEVVVYDVSETSFTLTDDGTYYVTYWSVDKNGLMGPQGQTTVNATPSVGGGSGGSGGGGGGGPYCIDLDLLQENGQGELVYSLDGGQTWEVYTGAVSICNETPTVSVTYGYVAPSNNVERAKTLVINIQKTSLGLILPGNIVVDATSVQGAVVTYNASATGATSFYCSPASGSLFPIATTAVSCTASDAEGNSTSGSFTVTVRDIEPPVLSLPPAITAEATGPGGATVAFSATATDGVDGSVPVTCTPVSGSVFPIGATQVNCLASDTAGNSAGGSFTVTVQDTTAPALTCPSGISVIVGTPATENAIAAFLGGATATDVVDHDITLTNDAPSTYNTPGPVTVMFTATDDFSNSSACSSVISVEYNFGGFLQPVSLLKPFKFGSTVPVKFQLTDYTGTYVTTAQAVLSLVPVSGNEPSGEPIDGTSNVPDSGNIFRYDATSDIYIYNLATDLGQLSIGTWNIVVSLDDGTTRSIEFKLK